MDRQAPSPDECDGIGMQRPEFLHHASLDSPRQRRRETGLYGAPGDRASPTWGRSGKDLRSVSANCARTDAFSAALGPLPTSASTDVVRAR